MTYKGDSSGKRVQRARFWINAIGNMAGSFSKPCRGILVLAGHGGDMSTLAGLGVPEENIVAVDCDKEAAEYCQELYPKAKVVNGWVDSACRENSYNIAHLDFCGGLSQSNIWATAEVAKNFSDYPALLGVTMMKGREHACASNDRIMSPLPRASRRRRLKSISKAVERRLHIPLSDWVRHSGETVASLYRPGKFDPMEIIDAQTPWIHRSFGVLPAMRGAIGSADQFLKKSVLLTSLKRTGALAACVNVLLEPYGLEVWTYSSMGYHSVDRENGGLPFVTSGFVVGPTTKVNGMLNTLRDTGFGCAFDAMTCKESEESIRGYALSLCASLMSGRAGRGVSESCTESVAQILDLPQSTISAWKAHETRGTYVMTGDAARHELRRAAGQVATETATGWKRVAYSEQAPACDGLVPIDIGWGERFIFGTPEQRERLLSGDGEVDWGQPGPEDFEMAISPPNIVYKNND